MSTREEIKHFVQQEFSRVGFTANYDYKPTLGFKLTNNNYGTSDNFTVGSLSDAENIVISFIPTAKKDAIFTNDIFDENKSLYLRVKVFIP